LYFDIVCICFSQVSSPQRLVSRLAVHTGERNSLSELEMADAIERDGERHAQLKRLRLWLQEVAKRACWLFPTALQQVFH
jgi:hypothetical protein